MNRKAFGARFLYWVDFTYTFCGILNTFHKIWSLFFCIGLQFLPLRILCSQSVCASLIFCCNSFWSSIHFFPANFSIPICIIFFQDMLQLNKQNWHCILSLKIVIKGQTNSKWFFQADLSSKKTNEQIRIYYLSTCFRSFFGRKWGRVFVAS